MPNFLTEFMVRHECWGEVISLNLLVAHEGAVWYDSLRRFVKVSGSVQQAIC